MERQSYWYRRRMGVKYPEQFISMVIDGRFLSLSECLSIIFTGNYCNFVFFFNFFFLRSSTRGRSTGQWVPAVVPEDLCPPRGLAHAGSCLW